MKIFLNTQKPLKKNNYPDPLYGNIAVTVWVCAERRRTQVQKYGGDQKLFVQLTNTNKEHNLGVRGEIHIR